MDNNNNNNNNTVGDSKDGMDAQFIEFLKSVKTFVDANNVKVLIGTPCFGGQIHVGYFQSMLDLSINLTRIGVPFEVMTVGNESLITRARNGIVARFIGDKTLTHLMFIDADITFSWVGILKLIMTNKELSGGCYPKKVLNWEKVIANSKKYEKIDSKELMARSVDYVFNPVYFTEGDKLMAKVENGLVKVKDLGTGFMLIQRKVFDTMMYKYPELKYKNNVAGYHKDEYIDYFYNFFAIEIDQDSQVLLSEDYLFCKKWRELGGELWLDLGINLNHTGLLDYIGCLSINIGEIDILNKDTQITMRTDAIRADEKQKKINS
jgi:hypothetical protein